MLNKREMIRTLKAMQTNSLAQIAMLDGMAQQVAGGGDTAYDGPGGEKSLYHELKDGQTTARHHVQALQHAIDRVTT